jgi:anti-anti-sigma factor
MEIIDIGVPGLSVAVIEGSLDTASAASVEERILPLVKGARVVLDMAQVRFVSSAGLRVLLKAAKMAEATGGKFAICAMRPMVREIYEISGFDKIIPPYATREEAAAALS